MLAIPKMDGSIRDVARKAGVSIGTVSRVFNDRHDVSALTRVQVIEAAKSVHYMPRVVRRRNSIGLVVQDIEHVSRVGYVSDMMAVLAKQMSYRGVILELVPIKDLNTVHRSYFLGLIAIVFNRLSQVMEALEHLPVVLINNKPEHPHPNLHYVASDHAQGARLAAEHLLDNGHRRIAFMEVCKGTVWGSDERQRGFKEAFLARGLQPPVDLMRFCEYEPARNILLPLLDEKPTALLVCGEDLSLSVNEVLVHELKMKIPNDLSLVTYEAPYVSALMSPPQTTIAQPWEEMGQMAVEGIMSLVEQQYSKNIDIMLPNRLIARDSVKDIRLQ